MGHNLNFSNSLPPRALKSCLKGYLFYTEKFVLELSTSLDTHLVNDISISRKPVENQSQGCGIKEPR